MIVEVAPPSSSGGGFLGSLVGGSRGASAAAVNAAANAAAAGGEGDVEQPTWMPHANQIMCTLCDTDFTVVKRKHHCRCCGHVVCGLCR